MAKTLLNGVNEILKKVDVLDADAGLLTTLTDSPRQTYIDSAVQSINEVLDELYSLPTQVKPNHLAERTITLVTGDQDYILHSTLQRLRPEFGLINETDNHVINILEGDDAYLNLIVGDLDQDDTGQPNWAAIRPTDGHLWLDRAPTATENGKVYKYRFEQELALEAAADEFPFTDAAFRALVAASTELWKLHNNREFTGGLFNASMARAARFIRKIPPRTSWAPAGNTHNITDPLLSP